MSWVVKEEKKVTVFCILAQGCRALCDVYKTSPNDEVVCLSSEGICYGLTGGTCYDTEEPCSLTLSTYKKSSVS